MKIKSEPSLDEVSHLASQIFNNNITIAEKKAILKSLKKLTNQYLCDQDRKTKKPLLKLLKN